MSTLAKNEWCCTFLKEAMERCGQADIAVAVVRDPKFGVFFALEFRAVSSEDEKNFHTESKIAFRINMTMAIRFCPWCGADLRDFYCEKSDRLPVYEPLLNALSGVPATPGFNDREEHITT